MKRSRSRAHPTSFDPPQPAQGVLQRACACGQHTGGGECETCRKQREGTLQRAAINAEPAGIPPSVHQALRAPGQPLEATTRAALEPRFRHDFSRVRVHTDSQAADSAQDVNALAYTAGRDIVFGAGQYAPGTDAGQRLLAHELTHVVQQGQADLDAPLTVSSPTGEGERQAEAAAAAMAGQQIEAGPSQPIAVQRQPASAAGPPAGGYDLAEGASPMLARALGSLTIDHFATGKSDLTEKHNQALDATARHIVTLLGRYPGSTVRVIGHTDAQGKEPDNVTLGWGRAEEVRHALVKRGVPKDQIETDSRGESELLVKTSAPAGRNRRVEIRFDPVEPRFKDVFKIGTKPGPLFNPQDLPNIHGGPIFLPDPDPNPVVPSKGADPKSSQAPQASGQRQDAAPATKPGTPGDVFKALMKVPQFKQRVDAFAEAQKKQFGKLSPVEKGAVATTTITIGAGALVGIWSDPAARKTALDALNGQEVDVPGVPGLKAQVLTKDGAGGVLKFDLSTVIKALK